MELLPKSFQLFFIVSLLMRSVTVDGNPQYSSFISFSPLIKNFIQHILIMLKTLPTSLHLPPQQLLAFAFSFIPYTHSHTKNKNQNTQKISKTHKYQNKVKQKAPPLLLKWSLFCVVTLFLCMETALTCG